MIQRYYHSDLEALKKVAAAVDGNRAKTDTQVISNRDVLGILEGGLEPEIVIEMIRASFCSFDITPQTLMELRAVKVPANVVKEMVKARSARKSGAQ